jgi:hypothetical protein
MASDTRFFISGFYHDSVSSGPLSIPLRLFRIFTKIRNFVGTGEKLGTIEINDTSKKLSPVSLLSTKNAGVIDTVG